MVWYCCHHHQAYTLPHTWMILNPFLRNTTNNFYLLQIKEKNLAQRRVVTSSYEYWIKWTMFVCVGEPTWALWTKVYCTAYFECSTLLFLPPVLISYLLRTIRKVSSSIFGYIPYSCSTSTTSTKLFNDKWCDFIVGMRGWNNNNSPSNDSNSSSGGGNTNVNNGFEDVFIFL